MIKNPILCEKDYKYQRNSANDEIAIKDRIEDRNSLFCLICPRLLL